jgi:hypothetical protein
MSTKRAATRPPAAKPPGSAKRPPSPKTSARLNRAFVRRFRATVAILVVVTGVLAAADLARESGPNATSALENAPAGTGFEIYTLERSTGPDSAGKKKPDTILGENITGKSDGTVLVSAPRIQEYAALPSALAAVTINENNTSSLEVISFSGGPAVQVSLPKLGTVENLHAGPNNLIGFSFTSAPTTDRYWKKLFIYNIDSPSAPPKEIRGIDGTPLSVKTWTFVPGTASIVAQTDVGAMFLIDTTGDGKVTPLGLHAEMDGFIPGTQELRVTDRSPKPATIRGQTSTINLADGKLTPLALPENTRSPTVNAGKIVLLDHQGQYAQVISEYTAGKERSFLSLVNKNGSKILYQPEPAWSRIPDFCVSPDGKYIAVETTAPEGASDRYPNVPGYSPIRTDLIDLATAAIVGSMPGFLPSWCR